TELSAEPTIVFMPPQLLEQTGVAHFELPEDILKILNSETILSDYNAAVEEKIIGFLQQAIATQLHMNLISGADRALLANLEPATSLMDIGFLANRDELMLHSDWNFPPGQLMEITQLEDFYFYAYNRHNNTLKNENNLRIVIPLPPARAKSTIVMPVGGYYRRKLIQGPPNTATVFVNGLLHAPPLSNEPQRNILVFDFYQN
ncbi:MAG: hypothetical protein KDD40_05235, partial [Bdellovibrionales bacterium]|nr:hypothetical protein [Bdellovibrionales bacterium]